jgi:hypothetical protein
MFSQFRGNEILHAGNKTFEMTKLNADGPQSVSPLHSQCGSVLASLGYRRPWQLVHVGWPVVLLLVVRDSLKLHDGKVDGEPWLNS